MAETFSDNLMRFIAAELYFQNLQTASREMFGRSFFSLGHHESMAVTNAVYGGISEMYQWLTPDKLEEQGFQQPVGFPVQAMRQSSEGS